MSRGVPDPTGLVMSCLICENWQVDAPPRARASLGITGLLVAITEAAHAHQRDDHPDSFGQPVTFRGARIKLESGQEANGGLAGRALPRWWDWISTAGTR